MQIHINKGVFYSFKIKDRKRLESGILLVEGEDWVLISSIFSDYIVELLKSFTISAESQNIDLQVISG